MLRTATYMNTCTNTYTHTCTDTFPHTCTNVNIYTHIEQKNFGKYLKVGIVEDNDNRKDLADLVKFKSSGIPQANTTTLSEYVARMKEGQKNIYFLSGEGYAQCEISPSMDKVCVHLCFPPTT